MVAPQQEEGVLVVQFQGPQVQDTLQQEVTSRDVLGQYRK